MKKQLLTAGAFILFLFPLYSYAEDTPSAVLGIASSTQMEFATTSASSTPLRTFTSCSQEAIEERDTSIASSRLTYNTAMSKALTERKNREKAAVAIIDEDDKKDAIKASVDTYKHQAKAAQTALTQARKIAWQTFDNDVKKCRELEKADQLDIAASTTEEQVAPAARTMMMKIGGDDETKISEPKSFKDTLKDKLESFKSLFN